MSLTPLFAATSDQPSGTTQSAAVDDNGWITSVTDENGYKTCYTYDDMGRLASITYPDEVNNGTCDEDESHWKKTILSFSNVGTSAAYGLPANHWRQTVTTGNAKKVTLYDALWRPVVEQSYDATNISTTISIGVKRYDDSGRLAFQSYPMRTLGIYTDPNLKGSHTFYDALDRITRVEQNWEREQTEGLLVTSTTYLTGFKTQVVNPNGKVSTTWYQAYDQPTTDWPVKVEHPDGLAVTSIVRDPFGKPLSLARGFGSLTATRNYVYNSAQELCKTIEPETGSTVMHYDGAGNLDWSAAGLNLPSTTSCDDTNGSIAARKVTRTYDARNRLQDLLFPDGRGDQFWQYTPDGLPLRVHTVNVVGANNIDNAWEYNHRRLLKTESQLLPAWYLNMLTYEYDGNGSLSKLWYPSGQSVDFAPNALGQATKAGVYASNVRYHPSGSISGFTYGNGIAYSMTPNTRQLPARATHGVGVTDFAYAYDGNG